MTEQNLANVESNVNLRYWREVIDLQEELSKLREFSHKSFYPDDNLEIRRFLFG